MEYDNSASQTDKKILNDVIQYKTTQHDIA